MSEPVRSQVPEVEEEAGRRVGQILAGKYRVESVIGSGGMAHVFKATNTVIGRTVAIKILRSEHASNQETVERFLREARTANIVRHPNVIDVIDFGQDADGASFIVQELLHGESLYDYVCRRNGVLPLSELAEIMGPVLAALAEAHAAGVVHRDLKPENVFLAVERGRRVPKLLDFGISKVQGAELTAAGMMLGTPAYMAPEAARSSKEANPRSDVWAAGVMIFELLTGKVPFEGDTLGAMFYAITTVDAARLIDIRPDLPEALSRVVERCLKRDARERYADAGELTADLNAALGNKERAAKSDSAPPTGHEETMVGQPQRGGATLHSRLQSKSMAVRSAHESAPSNSGRPGGEIPAGIRTSAAPRTPSAQRSFMPAEPRMTPPSQRSSPGRPSSLAFEPTTRSSGVTAAGRRTRQTPSVRRAPVARRLGWVDAAVVLGVGILLAVAILAAFRMAR